MKARLKVDTEYHEGPKTIGAVDVWLEDERDNTYLGSFVGSQRALAKELEGQEFFGLADYVRNLRLGPIGYLTGMEVRKDLRGQGIGTAMVKKMIKEMRRLGVKAVVLHRGAIMESSDQDLYEFYTRLGFEDVDCCGGDFWPVMRLDL